MYTISDNAQKKLISMKKRLKETREKKHYSQEKLAELLDIKDRVSISNWENPNLPQKKPTLGTFIDLCEVLGADPNYLLGVSDIDNQNAHALSKAIRLSVENVQLLQQNDDCAKFMDFFLSSNEIDNIITNITKIKTYELVSKAYEPSFSKEICKKINKAFEKLADGVFISQEEYIKILKQEIPFHSITDIDEYITKNITEDGYCNLCNAYPGFETYSSDKKYDCIIELIADFSFENKIEAFTAELARNKIIVSMTNIVNSFIDSEIAYFRTAAREYASSLKKQ